MGRRVGVDWLMGVRWIELGCGGFGREREFDVVLEVLEGLDGILDLRC